MRLTGAVPAWTASSSALEARKRGASEPGGRPVACGPRPRGTKRHQAVDKNGLPLATVLSGANVPDGKKLLGKKLLATVDAIAFVRGKRGRPRHRPEKVHADKAYDDKKLGRGLRKRRITPRIARRGIESGGRLPRFRWVAERTFSWQQGARSLRVRDERRDDIYEAFVKIENALVSWGRLNGHFLLASPNLSILQ